MLGALADKIKVLDAKVQLQFLSLGERIERLEVKKELSLYEIGLTSFGGNEPNK